MLLEELGARGAQHEERHVLGPVGEVHEEREQRLVGPMQVLEDEYGWAVRSERLQEAPPRRERLLLSGRLPARADERREASFEPGGVRIVRREREIELFGRLLRRVGAEDPGRRLDALT